jgi:succinate-semialdehyde dehydrogenase/glutarate-semialdehyde dehydrogenase
MPPPIFCVSDKAETIAMANHTEFGLAADFYAHDIGRIWRVTEAMEYGIVGVNTILISTEVAPGAKSNAPDLRRCRCLSGQG